MTSRDARARNVHAAHACVAARACDCHRRAFAAASNCGGRTGQRPHWQFFHRAGRSIVSQTRPRRASASVCVCKLTRTVLGVTTAVFAYAGGDDRLSNGGNPRNSGATVVRYSPSPARDTPGRREGRGCGGPRGVAPAAVGHRTRASSRAGQLDFADRVALASTPARRTPDARVRRIGAGRRDGAGRRHPDADPARVVRPALEAARRPIWKAMWWLPELRRAPRPKLINDLMIRRDSAARSGPRRDGLRTTGAPGRLAGAGRERRYVEDARRRLERDPRGELTMIRACVSGRTRWGSNDAASRRIPPRKPWSPSFRPLLSLLPAFQFRTTGGPYGGTRGSLGQSTSLDTSAALAVVTSMASNGFVDGPRAGSDLEPRGNRDVDRRFRRRTENENVDEKGVDRRHRGVLVDSVYVRPATPTYARDSPTLIGNVASARVDICTEPELIRGDRGRGRRAAEPGRPRGPAGVDLVTTAVRRRGPLDRARRRVLKTPRTVLTSGRRKRRNSRVASFVTGDADVPASPRVARLGLAGATKAASSNRQPRRGRLRSPPSGSRRRRRFRASTTRTTSPPGAGVVARRVPVERARAGAGPNVSRRRGSGRSERRLGTVCGGVHTRARPSPRGFQSDARRARSTTFSTCLSTTSGPTPFRLARASRARPPRRGVLGVGNRGGGATYHREVARASRGASGFGHAHRARPRREVPGFACRWRSDDSGRGQTRRIPDGFRFRFGCRSRTPTRWTPSGAATAPAALARKRADLASLAEYLKWELAAELKRFEAAKRDTPASFAERRRPAILRLGIAEAAGWRRENRARVDREGW